MAEDWRQAVERVEAGKSSGGALENDTLDFKTEHPQLKDTLRDLCDAAVCFANGVGGVVVVGISDTGTGPEAIKGCDLDMSLIRRGIYERTEPPLTVMVEEFMTSLGRRLVAIQVQQGLTVYSTSRGYTSRRVGTQCVPMRPMEIANLSDERNGRDWSAETSARVVDDIAADALLVAQSLLRLSNSPAASGLLRLSKEELVVELGLSDDGVHLNNAGAVLLCESGPGDTTDLVVYQYRQTRSGEAVIVKRWGAPMLTAHREALSMIENRLTSISVTGRAGQQITLEDFPLAAIREALTNALVHGDLRDKRPVQIEHSPEMLTITSPGPLVSGITELNFLTHGSRPRFPRLARALTTLALVEGVGQGFDRMFRETVRNGRQIPQVHQVISEESQTVVTFFGGSADTRFAKFISELPAQEQQDTDALLISYALCSRKSLTARDVGILIQRPPDQAEQVLRRLASGEDAIIEPTPGTMNRRQPNYRFRSGALVVLGASVKYNRGTTEDMDRKIIDHVREYQTINSASVQRTFDMSVYQARDVLSSLVKRGILARVSVQTRGPSVKYGEGPNFPESRSKRRRSSASNEPRLPGI